MYLFPRNDYPSLLPFEAGLSASWRSIHETRVSCEIKNKQNTVGCLELMANTPLSSVHPISPGSIWLRVIIYYTHLPFLGLQDAFYSDWETGKSCQTITKMDRMMGSFAYKLLVQTEPWTSPLTSVRYSHCLIPWELQRELLSRVLGLAIPLDNCVGACKPECLTLLICWMGQVCYLSSEQLSEQSIVEAVQILSDVRHTVLHCSLFEF